VSKRKAITERMKIDALLYVGTLGGIPLCTCGERVEPGQPIDWDHYIPLGLNGAHDYRNLRPLHRDCHRIKTSGSKATSAGSDIHKIAKVKRLQRKAAGTWKKTKRAWPKGRKMQSRPFQTKEKNNGSKNNAA
jgi:5-methylcytosine-specific restriction endonuclease McrA